MRTFFKPSSFLLSSVLAILFSISVARASDCADWVAKVVSIQGSTDSQSPQRTHWVPAKAKEIFCIGDTVRVGSNSRLVIIYRDNSLAIFDSNTSFRFLESDEHGSFWLGLRRGIGYFFSRLQRKLNIKTPFMNAGVSGTEFLIIVEEEKAIVTVFEGNVSVENEFGSVPLKNGQSALTRQGEAPIIHTVIKPRDAVHWALYYPPVLPFRPGDFEGQKPSSWESKVALSIEFYKEGQVTKAFNAISDVPSGISDPRFFTYRASLRLSVGRVLGAESDINRSLALRPLDGDSLALKSIIATAQNKKEEALSLANQAVHENPTAAGPLLAKSYALQADLRLEAARKEVEAAVALTPDNGLAWSRLAELHLMFRNLDTALEAAQKAVEIDPDIAHTQTVLGYTYLIRIDIEAANEAFEKAIAIDQAAPLPRLGLGLARIREGDLKEGRRQIEIAVMLDSNKALIRSYLGKSYYEEKRDRLAIVEYDIAQALDPKDPTPFLYSAILNQTSNRPVEALNDIQNSIERNRNRAVYRSRLMLDEDLGTRGTSLARTYGDLGFDRLALLEGWKSANYDPANHSAHRFLADSYAAVPRSEIARKSELLLSQLLQPLNMNPVQPRISEQILAGSGPANPSFNEFDGLYNRNRFQVLSSGVWGENATLGEELILSGLYKRISISASQLHHETDGYRENADLSQTSYNLFTQVNLTHKASIQGEFRFNETETGDLDLRFDPSKFSSTLDRKVETQTYRIGFHYAATPRSDILLSVFYEEEDEALDDSSPVGLPPTAISTGRRESETYSGEAQYLFNAERFNLIVGGGYLSGEEIFDFTSVLGPSPLFPPPIEIPLDSNIDHSNFYLYSYIRLPMNTTITLGGSGDVLNETILDRKQFNPKFGITWHPSVTTTLRLAAFRVLNRSLIAKRTIEPAQVSGFQQFFDDTRATESKRYGVGWDQRFSSALFGGLEGSKRMLQVPFVVGTTGGVSELQVDEWIGRVYLYWAPLVWIAASAEYQLDRLANLVSDPGGKIKTRRLPLGLNLYHSSGLFTKLSTTFVDQEATFTDVSTGRFVSGEDRFWIVNAVVGYRLPKRRGIFTVEVKNLFDENFQFQDELLSQPLFHPDRVIFGRLTILLE